MIYAIQIGEKKAEINCADDMSIEELEVVKDTFNEIGVFPIRIGFDAIKGVIDESPTIDAVQVVRCKDCRFAMVRTKEEMNKPIKPQPILCEWLCIGVENDAYCSHGERREP